MPRNSKDSLLNTFMVAAALCLVCSFLVSSAATILKPIQGRNVSLDRKKNLLQVTGFDKKQIKEAGGINELFGERFDIQIIDLETGKPAVEEAEAALEEAGKKVDDVLTNYDQVWASKSKKEEVAEKVPGSEDIAGIKYREKFSHVFIMKDDQGKVSKYVFPVRGYGLWSMMKGYLAVEPDFQTIAGLTFYEQGETPGLGGEVENPKWKAKWYGKKIYDEEGNVEIEVIKGNTDSEYAVDGLSGATITSNGVSKMLKYWLGPEGFGPYIKQQKSAGDSAMILPRNDKGGSNG